MDGLLDINGTKKSLIHGALFGYGSELLKQKDHYCIVNYINVCQQNSNKTFRVLNHSYSFLYIDDDR